MPFAVFPGAVQAHGNRWYSVDNGAYRTDSPPLVTLHTVEGRMERSAIEAHRSPPHLWVDPWKRDIFQTVDLARPARALENRPGGAAETNRRGVNIQIELQAYADPRRRGSVRHVSNIGAAEIEFLAEVIRQLDAMIRQIDPRRRGVIPCSPPTVGAGDSGYGVASQWRLSADEFDQFSGGLLGHCHVPDNAHYDPGGDFPWSELVAAVNGTPPSVRPLGPGDVGERVRDMQRDLNLAIDARIAVDGDYGPQTAAAVLDAKTRLVAAGRLSDGDTSPTAGPEFLDALDEYAGHVEEGHAEPITADRPDRGEDATPYDLLANAARLSKLALIAITDAQERLGDAPT